MKLAALNYLDESSAPLEESTFNLEFNAIAAYQLMSGIAKDKIAYPIREYCTNAWDATVGAKNFDVHLPTWIDSTFRVRDYGPGLSLNEVKTITTCFFNSTKRDSNDVVGALGLGFKSAFAYLISSGQSSFTVRSFHAGQENVYINSIAVNGMPVCRLMRSVPSIEPSGVEISFAVRGEDIYNFESKAREILWFFSPRPNVNLDLGWPDDETVVVERGPCWTLYGDKAPFLGLFVRMGCVAYPIDLSQVGKSDWPWQMSNVVFDAKIGDLTIQTSREELGYDENTKQTILKLLSQFETDFLQRKQSLIDQASSWMMACHELFLITYKEYSKVKNFLFDNITFQGKTLKSDIRVDRKTVKYCPTISRFENSGKKGESFSISLSNIAAGQIVIEKGTARSYERLAELKLSPDIRYHWFRCEKQEDVRNLVAELHLLKDDYTYLNDIKLPKKEKKEKVRRVMPLVTINPATEHLNDYVEQSTGGFYFIALKRRKGWYVDLGSTTRSLIDLYTINNCVKELIKYNILPDDFVAYGFQAGSKIVQDPRWSLMSDYLLEKLRDNYDFDVAKKNKLKAGVPRDLVRFIDTIDKFKVEVPHPFIDVVTQYRKFVNEQPFSTTEERVKINDVFESIYGSQSETKSDQDDNGLIELKDRWGKLLDQFSLFSFLISKNSVYYDISLKHFTEYFNLIEGNQQ